MWELIRANKRRSFWMFFLMGFTLILLGALIGGALGAEAGAAGGIIIAGIIWLILTLVSFSSGSSILLSSNNAVEVSHDKFPQLFNVVEEMKIASGLPAMPKIYMINSMALNAFATGLKPEKSAVAITSGLYSRLNRDELQGVIAHEMAHIVNRDMRFMTLASVMLGSIILISEVFLRGMFYSSGRYSGGGGGDKKGGGQAILMVIALVFAILAPILARILYFSISRKREYLADASAARLTRYPEGLASALEKIGNSSHRMKNVSKSAAPLFISNPFRKKGASLNNLTSTHPPLGERIRILREMGGASYHNYQDAYNKVKGRRSSLIPSGEMKASETLETRSAFVEGQEIASEREMARKTGNLMMEMNDFEMISCRCGMTIKVPDSFKGKTITCPRCSRKYTVQK